MDDVDGDFTRVSFSSRSETSTVETGMERSFSVSRRVSNSTSGICSADTSPLPNPKDDKRRYRQFIFRKSNCTAYNILHHLGRLFTVCYRPPFEQKLPIVHLGCEFNGSQLPDFFEDVNSRMYFSYRTGFTPLKYGRGELRCDTGWGCTLRTGQMLLAEGLVRHLLGRQFRQSKRSAREEAFLGSIQKLFQDEECVLCPFSLHNLTNIGYRDFSKRPGEWYSPSLVAHISAKAMLNASRTNKSKCLDSVTVYVAQDNCIYLSDLLNKCFANDPTRSTWKSPIILLPLRLGIDRVNPTYFLCLQKFLEWKFALGFVGGRENASFFFTGYQGDQLIYLDPHYLQNSSDTDPSAYRKSVVKRMRFKELRPSCMLGFYCRTKEDLRDLLCQVQNATTAVEASTRKVFHLVEVSEGSINRMQSGRVVNRRSLGSVEVLSLFEEKVTTLK